jgi:hypothetical protein
MLKAPYLLAAVALLASQAANAAILTNPTITGSSAPTSGYTADRLFDGRTNDYASNNGGNNTFVAFDFGSEVTLDRFLLINRINSSATGFTLTLSDNSDFSNPVATIPLAQSGAVSQGSVLSLGGSYTARYAKWQVTAHTGFDTTGAMEMGFLSPVAAGQQQVSGVSVLASSSAAYNSSYAVANAVNGIVGADGTGIEFASAGAGNSMHVDFDFGSAKTLGSFDFFDRLSGDNVSAFNLVFSDTPDFSNILDTKSYSKGTNWAFSGTIDNPVAAQYVRFQTTASNGGNTGISDIVFYAVPEPSTSLLGGFGLLCLLRRRRH